MLVTEQDNTFWLGSQVVIECGENLVGKTMEVLNSPMQCIAGMCVVIPNHVPFTRILIPIACENPIPDSRKIHDRIHSRYQVGSRSYLSSSWHFSRLTCSSELFHHMLSMLLVNKQGDLSLTNKSSNYSSTDQSIKLAFYD
jgi:hypothetical protein